MVTLLGGVSGCFIGYDSRWGQQKHAQQHLAEARTPAKLARTPGPARTPEGPRGLHTLRLRVEATPTYAAEVVDWPRRFAETLALANDVFEPTFGVELTLAERRSWDPGGSEDDVQTLLRRLEALDPGDDVDWVIGLAGAIPRFEASFHELGVATVVGKHVVLRAITDPAEFEAFEAGLSELSQAEREKLRRARYVHKTTAMLLHELGHTLGALHERDDTNLMNAQYARGVSHYGPEAVELMRVALEHRTATGNLDDAGREQLLARYDREPSPWAASDRAAAARNLAARKGKGGAQAANAPPAPAALPSVPAAPAAALDADELQRFETARRLLGAGDAAGARAAAEPLFTAHGEVPEVAELRCQIAMRRNAAWNEVQKECAGVMRGLPTLH